MLTSSKMGKLKSNFGQLQGGKTQVEVNENELTTVFSDMQISALTRAVNISPSINSVTLGVNSKCCQDADSGGGGGGGGGGDTLVKSDKTNLDSCIQYCSTPKKNITKSVTDCLNFINDKEIEQKSLPGQEKRTRSDNLFSYQKLLQECDNQRRLTVDKVMRERIQNMCNAGKLIRDSLEHLQQTRLEETLTRRMLLESKIINDIQKQEILNKPKREAQLERENLKEAQRIQERNQKVKEAEEEARKKSEALLLKRKQIDQILFELQKEYHEEYKAMLETIKDCKDKAALTEVSSSHAKMLKDCAGVCEGLLKKCKQGDVTEDDVVASKKLVKTIKSIHEIFLKEIARINEAKAAESAQEAKEEEKPAPPPVTESNEASPASGLEDCYDVRSFQMYTSLKANLEDFEKSVAPLLADDSMKKFRFNCQKAVNIPVNAISPVSASHLSDKYLKLQRLLSGQQVEVGDLKVTAAQHPLGIDFCKNILAKKFVRQGDLTVSSKPDAAFSIAAVLASLWVDFPDFGQLVLGHFHAMCPYLAPVFLPQLEGQSVADYHKSLGYHYSQSGDVEKQDIFLKRMSGIMRLYAALVISKPRQPGKINPLGLSEGWRWISAILNLEPRPDICATLLYDFLEVAGHEMFKAYGVQFKKLLAYICQEYFPKLEKVTPSSAGGPIVRLEGFLQKILKEKSIPPPQGVLPPGFW